MSKFTLEFSTDNDAFEGRNLADECERILHAVAERAGIGRDEGTILDINGNTVGRWRLELDED